MTAPLLRVESLRVTFRRRGWSGRGRVAAVDRVSLELARGQVLGIIGESGSGKSTLGRAVLGLARVESGRIDYDGLDITRRTRGLSRRLASRIQAVFQDTSGTLDPRMTVRASLREALQHRRGGRTPDELLELVGLRPEHAARYPHELSGGQRQRVGIARALAVEPELVICDEPTASLDVSIQAQMLNLLADLTRRLGLTLVFIGHNIAVVRYLSDDVAVMLGGRVVERGPADEVCHRPRHPYTRALVAASEGRVAERSDTGDDELAAVGCPFRPRCPLARALGDPERCRTEDPQLRPVAALHEAACHFTEELTS